MSEPDARKAINLLRRRLMKAPRDAQALTQLAGHLADAGQDKEAEGLARRAHRAAPTAHQPLWILGRILQLQGRYDDALAVADAALAANPGLGAAWQMRGDSLANSGRQREAIVAYAQAVDDAAVGFEVLVRLGKMHRVLGETDQALAFFEQAARRQPGSSVPVYERALLRLETGDFAQGWRDYAARWGLPELTHRGFVPVPMVPLLKTAPTKADLLGQRVLLIGDQGIGDQVMYASMLSDLQLAAKSVTCLCEPRLMRLLQNAFPKIAFVHPSGAQVDSDAVDVLLAMGGLGAAFRNAAADFPGRPYVKSQAAGVARWEARLGPRTAPLRVGISWRGGVPQTGRAERSLDLAALRPLLETPGCDFVSLQYGDVAAEIDAVNAGLATPIRHFPAQDLSDFQDFADLIETLDLVISVQNATVHLAGALGKPCLALLPQNPEWRYMRRGDRMPWYSSVRLIRQETPRDWGPVIDRAGEVLAGFRPGAAAGTFPDA